jgi:N-formylglutamate deformylase
MTNSERSGSPSAPSISLEASKRPGESGAVPHAIIHIPHASRVVPDEERTLMLISDAALEDELLRMTDAFTDELFAVNPALATALVFPVSRLVVDVERFGDDSMEPMAERGMGAAYSRTSRGEELRHLDFDSRKRLIRKYYLSHQFEFAALVDDVLEKHGSCLVIDAHSFSSISLPHEFEQSPDRPEICVGSDSYHTCEELLSEALVIFTAAGFDTVVNRPFSGTIVPIKHFRSDCRVRSVMIEINRKLYLNESTGQRLPDFDRFRDRFRETLEELISAAAPPNLEKRE